MNLNLAGNIRSLYRAKGPAGFVHEFRQALGLEKYDPATGKVIKHRGGDLKTTPVLEGATIKPEQISLRALAVGLMGEYNIDAALNTRGLDLKQAPIEALNGMGSAWVQEAGENVPSQFSDISVWNAAAIGLLEAKIFQVWNRPEFIGDRLCETIPTNLRSIKMIGIGDLGDIAANRNPGDVHQRAQLSERYSTTPITQNRAMAIDITREAAMTDITGQLLTQAATVSETLRLRKEYLISDTFIGATNSYNYDNTSYNTYLTSGFWINNIVSNPLNDWTNINLAIKLASKMTSQESGQPVNVQIKDILVAPVAKASLLHIQHATEVGELTNTLARRAYGPNPLAGFNIGEPLSSIYLWNRLQQSSLAFNETQADGIWFTGDFKAAFVYVENLPLTTTPAAPDSYTMADRGLIYSVFVDEMGIPGVREPRQTQRHNG